MGYLDGAPGFGLAQLLQVTKGSACLFPRTLHFKKILTKLQMDRGVRITLSVLGTQALLW